MEDEVTTERIAEWLVNQCANEDGWQIDVKIEVIPATDPCPMTDADRETLRSLVRTTIAAVHRHLKLRSWCEEDTPVVEPHVDGAGPWTISETPTTPGA